MDTILELVKEGFSNLIPKKLLMSGTVWIVLTSVVVAQVLIIITQAASIIKEIMHPQYIKKFKKTKAADILLSAALFLLAILVTASICQLCSLPVTQLYSNQNI